jgi:two-component system sensor histidine kinase/response regulator
MQGDEPRHDDSPPPSELYAAFRFYGRMTTDLILVFLHSGEIRFVNESAERILGCTPDECLGLSVFDFIHSEDRAGARREFDRWADADTEGSFLVETRIISRHGELRHLQWTVAPHREESGLLRCFVSHARDVTAQVQAAMRVQRSETRHRALLVGMLDPVVTIDGYGIVREVSRSVETIFGYGPEDLLGQNISILMPEPHSTQHDSYLAHYRKTGETGILGRTREFEVRRKDGVLIQCELSVSRVDVRGEPEPLFVGSFRDITLRKRVEQALAESEARMRAIFDQEYEFVGLLSAAGAVLEINHSALAAAGVGREEVLGMLFWDTPWWSGCPERVARLRAAVEKARQGEFVRFEEEYEDSKGRSHYVDFSLKPVRDDDGSVQYLIPEGRDITPLKTAHRRELAMQHALAEIGESASILAHEIKNPLTAVNLALRAVADRLGEDQRSVLEDLAMRLAKLEKTMRRTLAFARPLELELEVCSIREIIEGVEGTTLPELEALGVRLEIDCPDDLPHVTVDRGLLEEVLVNLVLNAREALSEGGSVGISVLRDGGAHLRILVDDDGPGILPSMRDDLFKPFATSKQGGTGLGLAIARKIVREHGGDIGVEESPMGGARFWVRLPAARKRSGRGRTRTRASA